MNSHSKVFPHANSRILIVDDNPAIHADFQKILGAKDTRLDHELRALHTGIFGDAPAEEAHEGATFQLDSAYQGQEALEKLRAATREGMPYSVAFVDVRMPPGWDGVETITHLWKEAPDLQIIICSAYSDYSWSDLAAVAPHPDQLLVLKKPFDNIEVIQMAHALTKKWQFTKIANQRMSELDTLVAVRTADLLATNQRLHAESIKRAADQERFTKSFHNSPLAMAFRPANGCGFLDANARFIRLLGARREILLAGGHDSWLPTTTAEHIRTSLDAGESLANFPAKIRTYSGELRDTLLAAEHVLLGDEPHHIFILQDITDRVKLEMELRHSRKMEIVGKLSTGLAADLSGALAVIAGHADARLGSLGNDPALDTSLERIVSLAQGSTELIRRFLDYSRQQIIENQPLSINRIVERTAAFLTRLVGNNNLIHLELAGDLPVVFADSSSIEQVIILLVLSARDAMPLGGEITITTSLSRIDQLALPIRTALRADAREGNYVCLSVADTGPGWESESLRHLFDPDPPRDHRGTTGRSLATADAIVQRHHGWMEAESEPHKGSILRCYLPYIRDREEIAALAELSRSLSAELIASCEIAQESIFSPALTASAAGTPRPKLVIVDDEPLMSHFLMQKLGRYFEVHAAMHCDHAIALCRLHLPDVILCDMMESGKDGIYLARQLQADPVTALIPVVIVTSQASEETKINCLAAGASDFMAKPFHLTELMARLNHHATAHLTRKRLLHQKIELEAALEQIRNTETLLVQNEKMAMLGRLSAGLIHEINNPLNYASQGIYLMKSYNQVLPAAQREDFQEILTDIKDGVDRVIKIVSDLRSFTRDTSHLKEVFEVRIAIDTALRFFSHLLKDRVLLEMDFSVGITVYGDINQFVHIVINLVQNAIDAMAGKHYPKGDGPSIRITGRDEGGTSVIRFWDNGPGMAPEVLDRMFEPFYTTKDVGVGMGLGLSICHGIVTSHHGSMKVDTGIGAYTEFVLSFPTVEEWP